MKQLSKEFCVSEQIEVDDVAGVVAAGFGSVICNRPDHEEPGQPLAADIATECEKNGVDFHYLPFQGPNVTPDIIQSFRDILENCDKPVLAYCKTGQRCAFLYANTVGSF